ncbi:MULTISPECIES: hypothetical protein [Streptomyces]|uniref:hypothetical protein n=1 Tax=Streptomyces TaxID=1883 RepID=UPI00102E2F36|nr:MULTISPECIES: hypothetical protein [Streptomyces]MYS64796.1 hypothetical protein [Streptomyces sp. SID5473]TAI43931.1 hypothetical protein EWI31_10340 [Streptomyces tsukubensis]
MGTVRKRAVAVMALAGAVALAGCAGGGGGGGGGGDRDEPELGRVPKVMRPADVPDLPMDRYLLDEKEIRAYTRAHAALSRRCMERFGMSWLTDAQALAAGSGTAADPARYFTLIDAGAARLHGYGTPSGRGPQGRTSGSGYEPTDAERAVYDGRAKGVTDSAGRLLRKGGCAAEVEAGLLKGGARGAADPFTVGNEFDSLRAKVRQDSRVTGAFTEWSGCMKDKGFDYRTPLDAANDTDWKSGTVSDTAIAVAAADVACKQRHNTVGIWYAATEAHQKAWIDGKAEHFAAVLAGKKALVDRSLRVVQGAP